MSEFLPSTHSWNFEFPVALTSLTVSFRASKSFVQQTFRIFYSDCFKLTFCNSKIFGIPKHIKFELFELLTLHFNTLPHKL